MPIQLDFSTQVQSTVLSTDGTFVIQTFTQSITQDQLNIQLKELTDAQSYLNGQILNIQTQITAVQGQIAMFAPTTGTSGLG